MSDGKAWLGHSTHSPSSCGGRLWARPAGPEHCGSPARALAPLRRWELLVAGTGRLGEHRVDDAERKGARQRWHQVTSKTAFEQQHTAGGPVHTAVARQKRPRRRIRRGARSASTISNVAAMHEVIAADPPAVQMWSSRVSAAQRGG